MNSSLESLRSRMKFDDAAENFLVHVHQSKGAERCASKGDFDGTMLAVQMLRHRLCIAKGRISTYVYKATIQVPMQEFPEREITTMRK